jgi:iron complex outermembrane receptor protein
LDIKIRAYGGRDNPTQAAVQGLLPSRDGLGFFQVDENRIGENQTSSSGIAVNVALAISSDLTITSISSYDIGRQDLQQAADGSPLNILDIDWQSHFRQYSEELRANWIKCRGRRRDPDKVRMLGLRARTSIDTEA